VVKSVIEWRHEREMRAAAEVPPERPPTVRPEPVEGPFDHRDRLRQAQPERNLKEAS
jgi:hypothetical protein